MKSLSLLIFTLFCTISAIAQPWIGPDAGNIYHNQGNVGIGTTSPGVKLEIKKTSSVFPILGTASGNLLLSDNGLWGTYFGLDGGTGTGWIQQMRNDQATAYSLVLNPLGGNVGIGTTSPGQKLTISDSATLGTSVNIINTSAGGYNWNIFSGGSDATLAPVGSLIFRDSNNGISRMVINSGGNVGIGTTTSEAKLTVKGKIVASEIQVKDVGAIPDYVFKPDYVLMPLSHVEEFVKQNQHLPEVPSEKEFKKDGMNVAGMNALLLKKVEELTLYAIDQNKRFIEQTTDQNKKLKEQAKKIEALEKAMNNLISK